MKKHQEDKDGGATPEFEAKVTGNFCDCLTRQISEVVAIKRSSKTTLNLKSEWHQPALWRVQNAIVRE